jgi:hypothetical protein
MNLEMVYGKEFALPGIAEKGYLVSPYFQCSHGFYPNFIG